jgi:hypothetical protein
MLEQPGSFGMSGISSTKDAVVILPCLSHPHARNFYTQGVVGAMAGDFYRAIGACSLSDMQIHSTYTCPICTGTMIDNKDISPIILVSFQSVSTIQHIRLMQKLITQV